MTTLKNKLQDWLLIVKVALTPIEDQWTWTTREGDVFEDVAVETIQADHVILLHKFGKTRVPIALLSGESRLKLERDYLTPVSSWRPERVYKATAAQPTNDLPIQGLTQSEG